MTIVKGVIFDNDDTAQAFDPSLGYGSTEDQYYAALEAIARTFRKHLEQDSALRKSLKGIDIRDVGATLIRELGLPITYEDWKKALDAILITLAPFASFAPGFLDAVHVLRARGIRVGIASSSVHRVLDAKWARYPSERATMECFVAGDDPRVTRSKPEPDLLFAAAADLHLFRSECAYVGDSRSDMLAAGNAGMLPILVHNETMCEGAPKNACLIRSFAELMPLLT